MIAKRRIKTGTWYQLSSVLHRITDGGPEDIIDLKPESTPDSLGDGRNPYFATALRLLETCVALTYWIASCCSVNLVYFLETLEHVRSRNFGVRFGFAQI
jgi:hypothetical protein